MIECMNFKKHEVGTLLGFANLYVPKMGIEIFGCTLHEKNGRRWLNLPSREYEDNGEKKYLNVIRFREKEHYEAFMLKAKEAIDQWCIIQAKEIQEFDQKESVEKEMPF